MAFEMDFIATEIDDGVSIRDAKGEVVAVFNGRCFNPAYLAFVQGLLHFPGAEIWNESLARYDLSYGEIKDESITQEIAEALEACKKELSR